MKKSKLSLSIIMSLLLTTCLSACLKDSGSSNSSQPSTTPTTPTTPEPEPETEPEDPVAKLGTFVVGDEEFQIEQAVIYYYNEERYIVLRAADSNVELNIFFSYPDGITDHFSAGTFTEASPELKDIDISNSDVYDVGGESAKTGTSFTVSYTKNTEEDGNLKFSGTIQVAPEINGQATPITIKVNYDGAYEYQYAD